jgi:hypothetical protein
VEYLSAVLSFLAGILSGWTLKVVVDRSKRYSNTQIGNRAGGDIAGRDINKK